jgi:hypothetical protein
MSFHCLVCLFVSQRITHILGAEKRFTLFISKRADSAEFPIFENLHFVHTFWFYK